MKRLLRVGVIGYGYAAATLHAPLIQSVSGLELKAISSSNPGKVHAALPEIQVEGSPEALLSRPDIDLVVIATPNETHFPLASKALAAGKHVVVDKPFTVTLEEACSLKNQAQRAGRVISAFHNRRWDSDFLTLKQAIDSAMLGRIVYFESHFDRFRPQVRDRWRERPGAGTGLWYDLGPHLLDQILQLFGLPESIFLDLAKQREGTQVEDWFHAVLAYGSLRAVLQAGVLVPLPAARFIVHGEKGTFIKHGLDPQEDMLKAGHRPCLPGWGKDSNAAHLTLWQGEIRSDHDLPCQPGNYPAYYEGVRDAVLGSSPNPVTAEQAITVVSLLELGVRSAMERRQVAVHPENG